MDQPGIDSHTDGRAVRLFGHGGCRSIFPHMLRNVEALCIACMPSACVACASACRSQRCPGKFRMFYGRKEGRRKEGTCGPSAGLLVTQGFVIMCGIEAAQMEKYLSRRTQEFI